MAMYWNAHVVKLVDMPLWGGGARKGVQVRILSWAQRNIRNNLYN